MDFAAFNRHTHVQNPGYAECYEETTQDLLDPVAKLNQEILLPNERNDSLLLMFIHTYSIEWQGSGRLGTSYCRMDSILHQKQLK